MTVGELLRRMDSLELTEWMAFFELQAKPETPTQNLRERFAQLAARKRK